MKVRITVCTLALIIFIQSSILMAEDVRPQAVREGEPLHLWFKRSPVQDSTTLVFHEPELTEDQMNDPKFRFALGPRSGESSSLVVYFPTDPKSNFLQFEYNNTLDGNYSFTLSAVLPQNATDIEFRLKVTIEMDVNRDGDYDEDLSFIISGNADSTRRTFDGDIPTGDDPVDRFDGNRGGRIRITLSREDDLNTTVLLYCGYKGFDSYLNLPYSKYTYVPSEEENGEVSLVWVLGIGAASILLLVFIIMVMNRKHRDEPEPERKDKTGQRRKRRR